MDIRCVSTGTVSRRSLPGVAFECLFDDLDNFVDIVDPYNGHSHELVDVLVTLRHAARNHNGCLQFVGVGPSWE